jgi:pyruvate dehydrogenase E1 component alpha subunit
MNPLPHDLRLDLYREQLRIRTAEDVIVEHYHEQEMRCPVHLCIGQEAVSAGACAAVEPTDYAISHHRSHGHYIAKGGDLKAMMAEIYGKADGCAGGKGGSMHLIDQSVGFLGAAPIVGSTIPIGVGAAFSSMLQGDGRVTLIFLGDGAMETGVAYESLNFAVLKSVPAIFICENNFYSVNSPMSVRQPETREIVDLARGHGIPAEQADGNDIETVYGLTAAAVARARAGEGPTFLEFTTYRWREHCGPNYDHTAGFREQAEYDHWLAQDPVAAYRKVLLADGVADAAVLDDIESGLRSEAAEAIAFAKNSPFPDPATAPLHVYAS